MMATAKIRGPPREQRALFVFLSLFFISYYFLFPCCCAMAQQQGRGDCRIKIIE